MISNIFYFTTGIFVAQEFPKHVPNVKSTIVHIIDNTNNPKFSTINYLISIINNSKK